MIRAYFVLFAIYQKLSVSASRNTIKGICTVDSFPAYDGSLSVRGTIAIENESSGRGITLKGTVTGLRKNATGGIHIHSGVTCSDANEVGGHYYDEQYWAETDPWNLPVTYSSDSNGVSTIDIPMDGFSLTGEYPVAGRVIVVHDANGEKIGCGVIESTSGEVIQLANYPGLSSSNDPYNVSGTLLVSDSSLGGINITGTIGGLQPDATGGIHVHAGYSCSDDIYNDNFGDSVGNHYFEGLASDPWIGTTYTSDSNGYWHGGLSP